jgi:hypothetical protein
VADSVLLYGLNFTDGTWQTLSKLPMHVYSFHECPNPDYQDESKANIPQPMAAFYAKGKFYCLYSEQDEDYNVQSHMDVYDAKTWEKIEGPITIGDGVSWDYYFRQIGVYDPTTDKAYTMSWGDEKPLLSINLTTYETEIIGNVNEFIQTMFIGKDGTLYGISFNTGHLYKIDKSTAATVDLGAINPFNLSADPMSAVTDPVTGKTYWVAVNGDTEESALYSFTAPDTTLTKIADMPGNEHFLGLYIPYVESAAPAAPTNLSFDYSSVGSNEGTLKFTVPQTTYLSDETLSGTLTAVISIDGTEETFSVTPGQEVTLDKTLAEGAHIIEIFIRNSAGDGAMRRINTYTGSDVPSAVSNLMAENIDNTVKLTWTMPTTSLEGGPVDDNTISVRIVRYPDEVVVADQLKNTTFDDVLPAARLHYYYEVISLSGTREGGVAYTDTIPGGTTYVPPFTESFTTQEDFDLFKVIDNNNDGQTWSFMILPQCAYLTGNGVTSTELGTVATYDDDYLITPPIALEANTDYCITYHCSDVWNQEHMRLLLGTEQNLTGSETVLDSDIVVPYGDGFEYKRVFSVPAGGNYYLFFHENTVGNSVNNRINDFTVSIEGQYEAPDSVTSLTATAGAMGALTNSLSFVTPTKTYNGEPLDEIKKIEIYKNNSFKPVTTFEAPAMGIQLTWDDPNVSQGLNNYEIVAYNSKGRGRAGKITNWTGIDVPMAPQNVHAYMVVDDEVPSFTWTAPGDKGVHGGYVDVSDIKYIVGQYDLWNYDDHWPAVSDSLTDTEFTYDDYWGFGQAYVDYQIFACNSAGKSGTIVGITIGTPYERPYIESFANGIISQDPWTRHATSYDYAWNIVTGQGMVVKPYDADGGMLSFTWKDEGSNSEVLEGPRVSLQDAEKPELSFYMYHGFDADEGDLKLYVYTNVDDAGFELVDSVEYNDGTDGWSRHAISLPTGANNMEIALGAYALDASASIFVDKIKVDEGVDLDASVENITVSKYVEADQPATTTVRVANNGMEDATDVKVQLYVDSVLTDEQTIDNLASNANTTLSFQIKADVSQRGTSHYIKAVSVLEGDAIATNDTSAVKKYTVLGSILPVATNLTGNNEGQDVRLLWNKPATDEQTDPVTDDFEDYDDFIIDSIGDWTVYDGDGTVPVYFGGPSIAHEYEPQAWQIWNPETAGFSLSNFAVLTPHSGSKVLACWAASDGTSTTLTNDDWLISSEIMGGSNVDFYLRVPNSGSGAQVIEMLYSTKDSISIDNLSTDFVAFDRDSVEGTTDWVHETYQLPKDARFFAVRCCTYETHTVLFMDDITYTPLFGSTSKLTLNGYNVYRDGERIGTTTDTTYVDAGAGSSEHVYYVTVNWQEGESEVSNPYNYSVPEGVNELTTATSCRVLTGHNTILIAGAANDRVVICTPNGQTIYSGRVNGNKTISVPQGMYIVRAGQKAVKVVVR